MNLKKILLLAGAVLLLFVLCFGLVFGMNWGSEAAMRREVQGDFTAGLPYMEDIDQPFAMVLEKGWLVTVYDTDGNVLVPAEESV